ncbi:MAG: GIY-YIG nuclease family protein [Firmicutes bacterium]|nr:GIY-YIG nuclease family protein [Bacillota bacterium]
MRIIRHTELLTTTPENEHGTYVLILQAKKSVSLQIGKLGLMTVQPGNYVYIGSAFGPGGVRGRLNHHLTGGTKPHWHIDYLRQAADVIQVWYVYCSTRYEHKWAEIFGSYPGASVPMPGFGSSDCKCSTHLFFFEQIPDYVRLHKLTGL